jgi:hypothetical protein
MPHIRHVPAAECFQLPAVFHDIGIIQDSFFSQVYFPKLQPVRRSTPATPTREPGANSAASLPHGQRALMRRSMRRFMRSWLVQGLALGLFGGSASMRHVDVEFTFSLKNELAQPPGQRTAATSCPDGFGLQLQGVGAIGHSDSAPEPQPLVERRSL